MKAIIDEKTRVIKELSAGTPELAVGEKAVEVPRMDINPLPSVSFWKLDENNKKVPATVEDIQTAGLEGKTPLKWLHSYETLLFDTPSGDMEEAYYAQDEEKSVVYCRLSSNSKEENNFDVIPVSKLEKFQVNTALLTPCKVIGKAYYHEFAYPNGLKKRVKTNQQEYWDIGNNADYPNPYMVI